MGDLKIRAGRHRAVPAEERAVGKDGLTARQRHQLLTSFRAGIGSKPAPTDEEAHHAALVMDKLADSPIRRRPRS